MKYGILKEEYQEQQFEEMLSENGLQKILELLAYFVSLYETPKEKKIKKSK